MTYPQFILQLTDTTGAETLSHYLQIYEAGVFQNYDHGKEKNLEVYGTEKPPAYDMSKVPVPVALFVGKNDWLATPTVMMLAFDLHIIILLHALGMISS